LVSRPSAVSLPPEPANAIVPAFVQASLGPETSRATTRLPLGMLPLSVPLSETLLEPPP
jgi:hypothetical protein